MKNDEFWAYMICHILGFIFRAAYSAAIIWLAWELKSGWPLLAMLVGFSYKHDYKAKAGER